MSAFDESDESEELPERIIVVREPAETDGDEADAVVATAPPVREIDAGAGYDEVQAALDAPAAGAETNPIDLDEVDLRSAPDESLGPAPPLDGEATPSLDRTVDADVDESVGHLSPADIEPSLERLFGDGELHVDGSEPLTQTTPAAGARRAELDALVAQVAASQVPDDELESPLRWEDIDERPPPPRRDEAGPSTLRPKVPEPVIASRTASSPSRSRRAASQLRALLGLMIVVVLAGVGLAGAIGAAVLLVVLVLSRAFGSGS